MKIWISTLKNCRVAKEIGGKIFLLTLLLFFSPNKGWAAEISAQIELVGDATHLEFSGRSQWDYDLKRVEEGGKVKVMIRVPPLDGASLAKLKTWNGQAIEKVEINREAVDGQHELTFYLASKNIESFDYLTDDPSRLIIDFYKQAEAPKPVVRNEVPEVKTETSPKPVAKALPPKRNSERKPAATELIQNPIPEPEAPTAEVVIKRGSFDANDPDYKRFMIRDYEIKEESIIASRENIYIKFPTLRMKTSYLDELLANPVEYEIQPKEARENKEARLLLTLYKKKRVGAFFKTFKYFVEKYPESEYMELVRYLAADMHYDLWRQDAKAIDEYDAALRAYTYLIEKYPNSPLTERTMLVMGYTMLEKGDMFGAARMFQRHLDRFPEAEGRDRVRLAMADAFLAINKFDDALKIYQAVEKEGRTPIIAAEAAARVGDISMMKKELSQAVSEYKGATEKHKKFKSQFPNTDFNSAEALFWQGDYKQALERHIAFLKNFPDHEFGGYSITRAGEILEILGADQSRVMGAYLESFFRYRSTPGAGVARVRMLGRRMKSMKQKEMDATIKEFAEISAASPLPKMHEFTVVMGADGHALRGDYEKALEELIGYYQKNPTSPILNFVRMRILRNISHNVKKRVEDGQFLEALKLYHSYWATWLKSSNRLDVEYLKGQAYEQAGVYKEADVVYRKVLNKIYALKGTEEGREIKVNQDLPSEDSINLRLASIASKTGQFSQAQNYLADIKSEKELAPMEQVERIEIAASLARQRGDLNTAKRYIGALVDTWKGIPQQVARPLYEYAQLQSETGEPEAALVSLEKIFALNKDTSGVNAELLARSMELRGDTLLKLNRHEEAALAYRDLLDQFEDKRPMPFMRYKVGKIYFEKGNVKEAEKIWSPLLADKTNVYSQLATEQLKNAQWQDDYKKYLNRIPAMADMSQGGRP